MTENDLLRAREAVDRSAETCHRDILNTYADIAADMGDSDLEAAYRWMAEHDKWPLSCMNIKPQRHLWCFRKSDDEWELPKEAQVNGKDISRPTISACIHAGAEAVKAWLIRKREHTARKVT